MANRTLLIGLDGATFRVLDALMTNGTMPHLARLCAAGVRAPLTSVVPALTPPAWTSLMTGRGPGRHGIFDFFRKDEAQSHHIRLLTSHDVGCETIWEMASRNGLRATVLNFPLTFPPPAIEGHVVPGGWMPWRQLRLGCHPAGLYDRMKQLPWFNPRELAMDMTHEEKALEGCRREEYTDWINLHIRREEQWWRVLEFIAADGADDLVAVLFDGVDKLQHLCWRFIDPAMDSADADSWERTVRSECLAYFRQLDSIIDRAVSLMGPGANVVLASDHGFGPQVRTFFANAWLEKRGDLAWTNGGNAAQEHAVLGMGQLARHSYLLDWTRTRAYAPMPSGNGIHIVRADAQHPGGVPEAEYDSYCKALERDLLALTDPADGRRVVLRVSRREDVFEGPYAELAPDLTLELQDGGLLSILASDEIVTHRPEPTGSHRPDGIFIAHGPAFRSAERLPALSILDVAPLLLYSLDLPAPRELEGRLPGEAIEPAWAAVHAARAETRDEVIDRPAAPALDEEDEAEIMRRLQALGYVE